MDSHILPGDRTSIRCCPIRVITAKSSSLKLPAEILQVQWVDCPLPSPLYTFVRCLRSHARRFKSSVDIIRTHPVPAHIPAHILSHVPPHVAVRVPSRALQGWAPGGREKAPSPGGRRFPAPPNLPALPLAHSDLRTTFQGRVQFHAPGLRRRPSSPGEPSPTPPPPARARTPKSAR